MEESNRDMNSQTAGKEEPINQAIENELLKTGAQFSTRLEHLKTNDSDLSQH